MEGNDYKEVNRDSWNKRTPFHVKSAFYDNEDFKNNKNSLNKIELDLCGDVSGRSVLHLQCHFGQDSLSLAALGAKVTGVDISDKAIDEARRLSEEIQIPATFIRSDIYDLPKVHEEIHDIVYTSYGTILWLPDLNEWAKVIAHHLKPGGRFIIAEFHPFIYVYDEGLEKIQYDYFKSEAIIEEETGTYAERDAPIQHKSITWNHSLSEIIESLIRNGLIIDGFKEYDYSPYNCFNNMHEAEPGKYRFEHLSVKIPIVYSIEAHKPVLLP